jgi:hypothetical protein
MAEDMVPDSDADEVLQAMDNHDTLEPPKETEGEQASQVKTEVEMTRELPDDMENTNMMMQPQVGGFEQAAKLENMIAGNVNDTNMRMQPQEGDFEQAPKFENMVAGNVNDSNMTMRPQEGGFEQVPKSENLVAGNVNDTNDPNSFEQASRSANMAAGNMNDTNMDTQQGIGGDNRRLPQEPGDRVLVIVKEISRRPTITLPRMLPSIYDVGGYTIDPDAYSEGPFGDFGIGRGEGSSDSLEDGGPWNSLEDRDI